jgi:hypothetical protein
MAMAAGSGVRPGRSDLNRLRLKIRWNMDVFMAYHNALCRETEEGAGLSAGILMDAPSG